jgi:purine-binding chemotaxis protein CheW
VTRVARAEPWDRLAQAALRPEAPPAGAPPRQLLVCSLAGTPYALPIERVREIVRLRPITPMPRTPPAVRGVISLRGTIAQVVDLRLRLGLPALEPARESRIVVVGGAEGELAGLFVDAVTDVLLAPQEELRPDAAPEGGAVAAFLARGETFVSVLDVDRVLDLDGHR